ncbi:hypothetical protein A3Q56_07891 [Intoshia linei]|uniref:Uncharacterized protein n=1 Tax=Intoshia linei TaxID=1819745 RepID=A0A177AQY1_9BILA|nr:hypothetical protein A3Q56_07891 [Intoshia linei]
MKIRYIPSERTGVSPLNLIYGLNDQISHSKEFNTNRKDVIKRVKAHTEKYYKRVSRNYNKLQQMSSSYHRKNF